MGVSAMEIVYKMGFESNGSHQLSHTFSLSPRINSLHRYLHDRTQEASFFSLHFFHFNQTTPIKRLQSPDSRRPSVLHEVPPTLGHTELHSMNTLFTALF